MALNKKWNEEAKEEREREREGEVILFFLLSIRSYHRIYTHIQSIDILKISAIKSEREKKKRKWYLDEFINDDEKTKPMIWNC